MLTALLESLELNPVHYKEVKMQQEEGSKCVVTKSGFLSGIPMPGIDQIQ